MENGARKMENGVGKMENGAGKMENGAGKTGSAGKLNVQILRHKLWHLVWSCHVQPTPRLSTPSILTFLPHTHFCSSTYIEQNCRTGITVSTRLHTIDNRVTITLHRIIRAQTTLIASPMSGWLQRSWWAFEVFHPVRSDIHSLMQLQWSGIPCPSASPRIMVTPMSFFQHMELMRTE